MLTGYSVAGRGFAYLGIGPLYVGEFLLACGAITCVVVMLGGRSRLRRNNETVYAILVLFGWGLVRTIPFLPEYGSNALRDAATYGYSSFAVITLCLLRRSPNDLWKLTKWYSNFSAWFPLVGLLQLWIALTKPDLPRVAPDVPVIAPKGGDLGVHLGSILAFRSLVLAGRGTLLAWVPVSMCVLGVFASQRGGSLALLSAVAIVCVAGRWRQVAITVTLAAAVLMAYGSALASGWYLPPFWQDRNLTVDQIKANLVSLVRTDEELPGNLLPTRFWRLAWWRKIIEYTVFGEYFWKGKGFGMALGREDGITDDARLRSPHSVHMTYLARLGMPGVTLWLAVNALYCASMVRAVLRARAHGLRRWEALAWWAIACWLAGLVNASFDVYLEGPMGAVWFWTQLGVGTFIGEKVNTLTAQPATGARFQYPSVALARCSQ